MGDHEELGAKEISAIVLKENHVESKLRTVTMDSLRGQFVSVKLANVNHDLNKTISAKDERRRNRVTKVYWKHRVRHA
jgi:hypothetical protein